MKKFNLIILAGGEKEDWCQDYGCSRKALLPFNGQPMLSRVIDAYRKSIFIDKIIVVGAKELENVPGMEYVHKRVSEGSSFIRNLVNAILYLKTRMYGLFSNNHRGYLISFCDAAYLTTAVIDSTLENMQHHDPDIGIHYVLRETLGRGGFPIENRSYMPVAGRYYTGSNIYYVKRFRVLLRVLKDIVTLRSYRKSPRKILEHLGCEDKDFPGIEKVLSARLSAKFKIMVSPHAEMGVDVDKPEDYELALIELEKKTSPQDYIQRETLFSKANR